MLPSSTQTILERVPDSALVLDIGGWGRPLSRADWVLDLMPYETRGLYGADGDGAERFSADTWVQRDICARDPYPFEDGQFDFVVCSHTLEDVRDPVWVCSEMQRVGNAGYVEVPSRLEEQSWGVQGPWVGWGHHRWLVDVVDGGLEFALKPHIVHARESDHFPAGFQEELAAEERVICLWWEGSLPARERVFLGPDELDPYLADYVAREMASRPPAPSGGPLSRLRRRGGS